MEIEECDTAAIKAENKQIRREIYDLQDQVVKLEAELQEAIEENM